MEIVVASFEELAPVTAYRMWQLRERVFVVEQQCPYPDLDGRDVEPATRHVVLLDGGAVVGCARVLDDRDVWRVGRVVLDPSVRGRGLADDVMRAALGLTGDRDVVLDAQSPLAGWYAKHGFEADGDEFLEDGIPHTPMRLRR
ncbi:GNAT family N-acetyltransferase [Antribacter sp. KLBMP9083]|uniref:GNAT family N-acetyltransferase n=1 Tax=Antribacter soli TaxID=2910976 RepID=A0AA41UAH2_9MICO|nr:GNAT family N-acetyltransferase [Antribacter soli]MCF4122672.1 GNAT family N-acetyltransferase [Antribacter soli]